MHATMQLACKILRLLAYRWIFASVWMLCVTVQELQKYKNVNLDGITIEGCIDNPTVNPGHVVGLKHAQLSRCLL